MKKQEKIVVEGEIVNDVPSSGASRSQYAQKPTESALVGVWIFGLIAVFFSFIPIFGLCLAIFALVVHIAKKTPPVLPVFGIIIGSITTSLFLLLWLVLKAIF